MGIDFNLPLDFGQYTFMDLLKELANACRTDRLLTTVRLSSPKTIRPMRSTISWQPSDKTIFLFRPMPVHGVCPDNVSPEPSRHRSLSSSHAAEALPLRLTREDVTQYVGQRKRLSRLENLRRFRTGFDKQGAGALCQRRLRHATGPRGLRVGFNHHRFMSFVVSMGEISPAPSRRQGPHADGPKRLYPHVYPYYRRKSPRCEFSRRTDLRAGSHLYHGSRLSRLCSSLYVHAKPFNICYPNQRQFRLSSPLLSESRQDNRPPMRPDDPAQWLLCFAGLSCGSSPDRFLRHRDKSKVRLFNQQLCPARFDHRRALQVPLANRNLFQMDQAIPAYQDVFRHDRECREDSNLDCHQRLHPGSDCQEGTENIAEFGRNPANPQHRDFRDSSYYTSTYENSIAK